MLETPGQRDFREAVALALRLFSEGHTPEEVEQAVEVHRQSAKPLTALTDPSNDPVFEEVTDHGAAEGTG